MWRTAVTAVLVGAFAGAVVAAFAVSAMVRHLAESSLEEAAQVLVVLAEHEYQHLAEAATPGHSLPAAPHREVLLWQLRTSDGRLVLRSHDAPSEPWPAPLVEGHQSSGSLALFTVAGQGLWLQVAQPLNHLRRAQRIAAAQAGGAVVLLGLVAAAIVAWRIRVELRPLARLAKDVASIRPASVTASLPRSTRLELEPVYAALEGLLRRLADKLRHEKAFASQAAHSLRTPLAGLTAQLEVAKLDAPPQTQARLGVAQAAARRLGGVVSGLLALGRTEGPIDCHPFEARELEKVAFGGPLAADVSALDAAPALHGNLDLISAAVANLVDNAARHGASRVRIEVALADGLQQVRVLDDGPGIPAAKLARLRAALERYVEQGEVDPALGLGLTLAAAVARAHGGRVDVDCGEARPGFCVRISWPVAAPEAPARSGGREGASPERGTVAPVHTAAPEQRKELR